MAPSSRRRERLLLPLLVALAVGLAVALHLRGVGRRVEGLVLRERRALETARQVLAAESAHLARRGQYAGVAELVATGLLSLPVGSGAGATWVSVDGYRVDALLPTGPGVGGVLPLGLPGVDRPDPDLARRHVVVVARPERPGTDGLRAWYLDEEGRLFVAEGVSDEEGLLSNALPPVRVLRPTEGREPGLIWRAVDGALRSL